MTPRPASLNLASDVRIVVAPPNTSETTSALCKRVGTLLAVADPAIDESQMVHAIEWRRIGMGDQRPDLAGDGEGGDALDELFPRLAIGDQIGDRDTLEPVLLREFGDFRSPLHRPVIIGELADRSSRLEARQATEVDGSLRMA